MSDNLTFTIEELREYISEAYRQLKALEGILGINASESLATILSGHYYTVTGTSLSSAPPLSERAAVASFYKPTPPTQNPVSAESPPSQSRASAALDWRCTLPRD